MLYNHMEVIKKLGSTSVYIHILNRGLKVSGAYESNGLLENSNDGTQSEQFEYEENYYYRSNNDNFYCDTCDVSFFAHDELEKHFTEHKTCDIEGCQFIAHEKFMDKHVKMQHEKGFFKKIQNLEGPEEIAKWIAERKKRYPSKENVEKRYEKQMAILKRGERIWKKNRFDKNNKTRFTLKKNQQNIQHMSHRKDVKRKNTSMKYKRKSMSVLNEQLDWNETLFPFRGTKELFEEHSQIEKEDFDDSEWNEVIKSHENNTDKPVVNNALIALMGAYCSSDESENNTSSQPPEKIKVKEQKAENSDDEAPVEMKIIRQQSQSIIVEETDTKTDTKTSDNNRRNRKRKKLKRGKKNTSVISNENTSKEHQRSDLNTVSSAVYKKRKVTLLERLLDKEIKHERNTILQCVRYVVDNNFFQ